MTGTVKEDFMDTVGLEPDIRAREESTGTAKERSTDKEKLRESHSKNDLKKESISVSNTFHKMIPRT